MKPAKLDIEVKQGAVFNYTLTITDENDSPVPFPIGTTAKMQVRDAPESAVLADLGVLTTVGETDGTITIHASSAIMALLAPGKYRYDLFTSFASDDTPWVEGSFTVQSRIST